MCTTCTNKLLFSMVCMPSCDLSHVLVCDVDNDTIDMLAMTLASPIYIRYRNPETMAHHPLKLHCGRMKCMDTRISQS